MRGFIAGALFGAEIYVPYLLIERAGLPPTLAGLGLTAAAILWAAASEVSGRFGDRLGNTRIALLGVAQLFAAAAIVGLSALLHLPPAVAVVGWAFAGSGMGLMYPRLTVLTLAYSTPQNQGFNSSALSIFDARLRSRPGGTGRVRSSYGVRAAISHWWLRNEPPNAAWKKLSATT